ncbi:MAG TPA: glycoside hydrolase family 88 protein [Bacteroidales bacterium]|jgi:unsaturated rhamnogalacturonyl hydrolase|nr:glycoside hydrolase family 88 protein [Bacteroidales bacterium]HOH23536.1 glycoside hydrolase family 88 protein [Bacteroidales bacterium]HPB35683.1 glycoside hydrolase family 88 protein [Bacteroidales bacterium]HPH57061.1 glycoside hydrolase family 88 protein [Bacteroidales bacterium]
MKNVQLKKQGGAIWFLVVSTLLFAACGQKTTKPLSVRMAESEMIRTPVPTDLDGCEGRLKWNYTHGLELLAFMDLYDASGDERFWNYAARYADTMINAQAEIVSYKKTNYNIDHICPGRILFRMYDRTGEAKYKMAMDTLFSQLQTHPRTSDGGFWHKKVYPYQMWLDGLYMGQPFYAEYISRYVDASNQQDLFEDVVHQFVTVGKHTYDAVTGVYRHGWDESRAMFWADKETGQSAHCWGRGLGWYVMGLVDALDYIPGQEQRQALIDILKEIYEVLPKYADPQTGMWYQVLEFPEREGNYQESTASIMFVYGLLKGVKTGVFDASYRETALQWYEKFVDRFVKENLDGTISITDCCAGAGLGGSQNRSGKYDYYINETIIIENDCKAVGPFIQASLIYEEFKSERQQ